MIPARLIRTVPTVASDEAEGFWRGACELHPHWDYVTFRDPVDRDKFPLTSPHWAACKSGAQMAGLIRLEALWHWGGIYLDSDVEVFRPLDSLRPYDLFATWESAWSLNDAVLGAMAGHPLVREAIALAIERLPLGALHSGPKVVNDLFRDKADVLLLPPRSFSPYLWNEKHRRGEDHTVHPGTFGAHHWANSHGA
jgi:mannosyltransferase OCH1-like enzyme